ncbi:MAG: crossover junction endodeoxyribonuclease RuvC [Bernardetiaceae bacterium]|nr:crossover junction endodeoxyribonuclease RuvC [Bernardetiaceae bacterium]
MQKKESKLIILGIDPGTSITGYGVLEVNNRDLKVLQIGVIKLQKYDDHYKRLEKLFERCTQLINTYKPDEMALEAPFFGKNVQSMLKLGRAQGIAMAAALAHGMPVAEYSPRKVKQSVTGKGTASKEQVAGMLQKILNFKEIPQLLDATDALAVALCHYYQRDRPQQEQKSWKAFLANNPDRVKG